MKKWYNQKTFWAGVALIVNGLWPAIVAKDINLVSTELILGGLGLIFLREAVNGEKK